MIAATTPPAPGALTVPIVRSAAKAALTLTLVQAGKGHVSLTKCHKTARRYGVCNFSMVFKSSTTGRKFTCTGKILVRDLGQGPESSYKLHSVYCNKTLVN